MRMAVPVMQVGKMGVAMDHRRMTMPVTVRFGHDRAVRMIMLVVGVVDMAMLMLKRFVGVLMTMRFGQVQPESDRHEYSSHDQRRGDRFAEHRHREQRTNERRGREIGA